MADKHVPNAAIRRVWLDPRLTTAEAAAEVGLTRSNIWLRAKALGLPARKLGTRYSILPPDEAEFADLWLGNVAASAMAAHFNVHFTTISKTARRLGLPLRQPGGHRVLRSVAEFTREKAEDQLRHAMVVRAKFDHAAQVFRGFSSGRTQRSAP